MFSMDFLGSHMKEKYIFKDQKMNRSLVCYNDKKFYCKFAELVDEEEAWIHVKDLDWYSYENKILIVLYTEGVADTFTLNKKEGELLVNLIQFKIRAYLLFESLEEVYGKEESKEEENEDEDFKPSKQYILGTPLINKKGELKSQYRDIDLSIQYSHFRETIFGYKESKIDNIEEIQCFWGDKISAIHFKLKDGKWEYFTMSPEDYKEFISWHASWNKNSKLKVIGAYNE